MKYYVTSDTHGFYTLLHEVLKNADFFQESDPCKLIIIGDLFDRGKEAVQMQDFILGLMEED